MSSRALRRRLQEGSDLDGLGIGIEPGHKEEDITDDESTLSMAATKKKSRKQRQKNASVNPFDLLNGDEKEDSEEKEEQEENVPEEERRESSAKASRTKKKKNKKKGKDRKHLDSAEISTTDTFDDIDASLLEVNRILGDPGIAVVDSQAHNLTSLSLSIKPLLHIDFRNLNPDTEMKRMFGSDLFRGEQQQRNRRQRNRPILRNSRLVQAKDTWHPTGGCGLSMKYLGEDDGFIFEHSPTYQKLQHKFQDGIESGQPEHIFSILQENPYHIDTLITLADFYNTNEDFQTGAECIEKALYGLECAFHSMFNIAAGNCYLDYKRRENRCLYICLFKHILNLGRRGCNRTAFEFCKVLLSVDPKNDPLNCLSFIDFYALRCEQYDYLLRLDAEILFSQSQQLRTPNFAFSIPLAHFKIAHSDDRDTSKADELLQDTLLLYPMALLPLLDKCSVQPDKRVSSHAFFSQNEVNEGAVELNRLIKLYVDRCECCWKEPIVMQWLESNVKDVLDIVDEGKDPRLKKFPDLRKQQFKHPPPSIKRHYFLSGVAVPTRMSNTAVYVHNPFPPSNSIAAYQRPPRSTRAAENDRGILSLLLESLFPNYNPYEPSDQIRQRVQNQGIQFGAAEGAEDGDGDGGARALPQQLQNSVNAIMDAMRNLLHSAIPVPPPQPEEPPDDENERAWEEDDEDFQNNQR